MSFFALVEGQLTRATETGQRASCAGCDVRMDAVISATPHWRHFLCECRDSWQRGKETEWHLSWKNDAFNAGADIEQPMALGEDKHRADIVTPEGRVVEVQRSPITIKTISKRLDFYPEVSGLDMVWIFDASQWGIRLRAQTQGVTFFKWQKRPAACEIPPALYLDLGNDLILEVLRNAGSYGAECQWSQFLTGDEYDRNLGWGRMWTRAQMLQKIGAEEWPAESCNECGLTECLSPFRQLDEHQVALRMNDEIDEEIAKRKKIAAIEAERSLLSVDEAQASGLAIQVSLCHAEAHAEDRKRHYEREKQTYLEQLRAEQKAADDASRQAVDDARKTARKAAEEHFARLKKSYYTLPPEVAHAVAVSQERMTIMDTSYIAAYVPGYGGIKIQDIQ